MDIHRHPLDREVLEAELLRNRFRDQSAEVDRKPDRFVIVVGERKWRCIGTVGDADGFSLVMDLRRLSGGNCDWAIAVVAGVTTKKISKRLSHRDIFSPHSYLQLKSYRI